MTYLDSEVERSFQFSPDELKILSRSPEVLLVLKVHHDCRQEEARSIWEGEEGMPTGNAIRSTQLYERARSLIAEDPEMYSPTVRVAFGFVPGG